MRRGIEVPRLRRDGQDGLAEQIAAHFRGAIEDGRLPRGERLPTIRLVADELGVTRATVQSAYRQLADAGLVQATVGRGTEVVGGTAPRARALLSSAAEAAREALRSGPVPPSLPIGQSLLADFGSLQPDRASLPVDAVADALDAALHDDGPALLAYGDPAGDRGLREQLARRHATAREADPERVLISSGAQQGIDLVLRTLTEPGDAVAVPVPAYPQLFGALAAHELRLVPIETASGNLEPEALRRVLGDVRLVYAMPTFHNPTGSTLDRAQRRAVMDVIAASEVPVLEDGVECELRFAGEELPSLQSLDPRRRTVTVRSFSKGLFPGVRIGWLEASPELIAPMAALKRFSDLESSPLLQAALGRLLRSGVLDRELGRLRNELRARHAAARAQLARAMPAGVRWSEPEGGLSLWVELPRGCDARRVATAAARDGVLVVPGDAFHPRSRSVAGFRLSLSRAPLDVIAPGIEVLARHVRSETDPRADGRAAIPLVL
jgi:DNA-binding transcriptional MocR family regulator